MLNTHAEATFQIPDVTKVLAVPDLAEVVHAAGGGCDRGEDRNRLLNLYGSFTANTPLGIGGTRITEAVMDAAETALFLAMVAGQRARNICWSTPTPIRRCARFRASANSRRLAKRGCAPLMDGTIGKIKDFFVFRSQFVPYTGSGPVTTHNLAFARDAIGLVVRRLPQPLPGTGAIAEYAELGNFGMRVTMSYQPNTLAQQFTVDVLYGCGYCGTASECRSIASRHRGGPVRPARFANANDGDG